MVVASAGALAVMWEHTSLAVRWPGGWVLEDKSIRGTNPGGD